MENQRNLTFFEHKSAENAFFDLPERRRFEAVLNEIWQRERPFSNPRDGKKAPTEQPFFRFDGRSAKAKNWAGFVEFEGRIFEVWPKVLEADEPSRTRKLEHFFGWLGLSKRIDFPFTDAPLEAFEKGDWPEILRFLFAQKAVATLAELPFSRYETEQAALAMPRGRLLFDRWAADGLARGRWHKIDCAFELFQFDNLPNRALKAVTRSLAAEAQRPETQRLFEEILFVLDEVADVSVVSAELLGLRFSPLFERWDGLMAECRWWLDRLVFSEKRVEKSRFPALLLPMEVIFEDFVAGLLQRHFSKNWRVETQKSDLFLSETPRAFQLRHDVLLTDKSSGSAVIFDAKYKIRCFEKGDPKAGISQADVYQMAAYCLRRGARRAILAYPQVEKGAARRADFLIPIGAGRPIFLTAIDLPFFDPAGFSKAEKAAVATLAALLENGATASFSAG